MSTALSETKEESSSSKESESEDNIKDVIPLRKPSKVVQDMIKQKKLLLPQSSEDIEASEDEDEDLHDDSGLELSFQRVYKTDE